MPESLAIGVDLGATKIAAALVSRSGEVLAARQSPTLPAEGPEAVLDRIAADVNALASQALRRVAGVGIGSPGQINSAEGVVRNAANLGWDETRLASGVRSRLAADLPVWIAKDTNAGALAEHLFGAAAGCGDFVFLTIGSGLGAGVFANGALIAGANHNASELGHLSLDPDGRPCACGARGCAETVVSGPGLLAVTRQKLADGAGQTRLTGGQALTTTMVIAAARAGDVVALAAFAEVAQWLGIVMGVCVAVLNPALIVVGGGLGLAAADLLLPGARAELERRAVADSYRLLQVKVSSLSNSALGPACLVWFGKEQAIHYDGGDMQGQ